jgi:hypothetical protein
VRRTNTKPAGTLSLTSAFKGHLLPVGTKIEIRVTQHGAVGRLVRFTVRRSLAPMRATVCLNSRLGTPQKC